MVLWRPTTPVITNTQKRCPFHYRGLECKGRKSRDIWSNRQVWSWSTKWSRAKANTVRTREHTSHSKHPLPKTQEMTLHMDISKWSIMKLYWLCSLQLTHLKRPWCWEWLKVGEEGDDRGWDGWMASSTQWTWVWVNSWSWWWTREAWHAAVHGVAKS